MRWHHVLRLKLRTLLRRERVEADLEREMRFHLDHLIAEHLAAGMGPEHARQAALRTIGNMTHVAEQCRDARGLRLVDDARRDAGYALRTFRRSPAFSATAILTLALGIGAATAVFSVVRGVLLRPLPLTDADRLVRIVENVPAEESMSGRAVRMSAMNEAEFDWWRTESRTLSHMAAMMPDTRTVRTAAGAERLAGARVSPALFPMRGVAPVLGRWLGPEEEREGTNVVVLSESRWRRYFGDSEDLAGRSIVLDGRAHAVVGVMPRAFGPEAFWAPYVPQSRPGAVTFVAVVSRLADGVSLQEAVAEANALGYRLRGIPPPAPDVAGAGQPLRFEVVRELDTIVAAVRPALQLLVAAVALVLLIACANVANLLLARGATRLREIAVRRALGATRARAARQLLIESAVLALAGVAGGIAVAYGAVAALRAGAAIELPDRFQGALGRLGPTVLPRAEEIGIDPVALLFAVTLGALTVVLIGLAPAIQLSRADRPSPTAPGLVMRSRTTAGPGAAHTLAVAQLAMSTALLVGAGLLIHSFWMLVSVPLGFDSGAQVFQLVMPGEYSPRRRASVAYNAVERVRALPGVEAVGFSNEMPFESQMFDPDETLVPTDWQGTADDLEQSDRTDTRMVSPGYLKALGVRLVEGRLLDERDDASAPRAILVNRAWVQRYSANRDPIGLMVDSLPRLRRPGAPRLPWQIVGVVDVRTRIGEGPADPGDLVAFKDLRQWLARNPSSALDAAGSPNMEIQMAFGFSHGLGYAVRASSPVTLSEIAAAVRQADPALAVEGLTTMRDVFAGVIGRQRFYAAVIGAFGLLAAIVAAVGVYGVVAFGVSRRTQEMAVRLAVGGTPRDVLVLVLRQGIAIAAAGVALGMALASGLTRYLAGMLFGVATGEVSTHLLVATACAVVAMIATYLPARRATRVDPLLALRSE